jgi:hypothetical protein
MSKTQTTTLTTTLNMKVLQPEAAMMRSEVTMQILSNRHALQTPSNRKALQLTPALTTSVLTILTSNMMTLRLTATMRPQATLAAASSGRIDTVKRNVNQVS